MIDHLGLSQPHEPLPSAEPFADPPKLLALAAHYNAAVKISGACTLSCEPFPYKDIWDPLFRVFDAFGFDRCMWGTEQLHAPRGALFPPGYRNKLIGAWLSALDGVVEKLSRGAKVADVGCGHGWSTVTIAKAFQTRLSPIIGLDPSRLVRQYTVRAGGDGSWGSDGRTTTRTR